MTRYLKTIGGYATYLHTVIRQKNYSQVEAIILYYKEQCGDASELINYPLYNSWDGTALHVAAHNYGLADPYYNSHPMNIPIVKLLLSHGGDRTIRNYFGRTPAQEAIIKTTLSRPAPEVVALLK